MDEVVLQHVDAQDACDVAERVRCGVMWCSVVLRSVVLCGVAMWCGVARLKHHSPGASTGLDLPTLGSLVLRVARSAPCEGDGDGDGDFALLLARRIGGSFLPDDVPPASPPLPLP